MVKAEEVLTFLRFCGIEKNRFIPVRFLPLSRLWCFICAIPFVIILLAFVLCREVRIHHGGDREVLILMRERERERACFFTKMLFNIHYV